MSPNTIEKQRSQSKKEVKKPGKWSVLKDKFGFGDRWAQEVAYLESLEGQAPTPEITSESETHVQKIERDVQSEIQAGVDSLQTQTTDLQEEIIELDIDDLILVEEVKQVEEEILKLDDLEEVAPPTSESVEEPPSEEETDDTEDKKQAQATPPEPAPLVHPNDIEAIPVTAKKKEVLPTEPVATAAEPVVMATQETPPEVVPTVAVEASNENTETEEPDTIEKVEEPAASEGEAEKEEVPTKQETTPTYEQESLTESIERLTRELSNQLDTFDKRERITDNEYFQFLRGLPHLLDTLDHELPRNMSIPADEMKQLYTAISDTLHTRTMEFDAAIDALQRTLQAPESTSEEALVHIRHFEQTQQSAFLSGDVFPMMDELMDILDKTSSRIMKLYEYSGNSQDQDNSWQVRNFHNTVRTVKDTVQSQQGNFDFTFQGIQDALKHALDEDLNSLRAA